MYEHGFAVSDALQEGIEDGYLTGPYTLEELVKLVGPDFTVNPLECRPQTNLRPISFRFASGKSFGSFFTKLSHMDPFLGMCLPHIRPGQRIVDDVRLPRLLQYSERNFFPMVASKKKLEIVVTNG